MFHISKRAQDVIPSASRNLRSAPTLVRNNGKRGRNAMKANLFGTLALLMASNPLAADGGAAGDQARWNAKAAGTGGGGRCCCRQFDQ